MGGEKLKLSRSHLGIIFTTLIVCAVFFGIISPLSAQTPEPAGNGTAPSGTRTSGVDESTIIIGETPGAPAAPPGGSSVFVVIRMVLVLALAALAIYGVVFFMKRLARPRQSRDPHLKVLARVPLGSDTFAAVLSVGPKAWLVGGGSGGINLISEIDDTESLETMLLDDARRSSEEGTRSFIDFRSLLRKQRDRLKGM